MRCEKSKFPALKSYIVFCAKEVDLIKLNFSMTNKCFDSTQVHH